MKKWNNILWWSVFIIMAIYIQSLAPGLDVLVVGLIILLQEEDYRNIFWLMPLFVLLQEGMGTRPFGSIIIWYSATIVIFRLGRWLFDTENFLFVFLLSACLGCAYYCVAWLMAPLQNLAPHVPELIDKSLVQAIFMPFAWRILVALRPNPVIAEDEG